jgi:hypothetical protein
MAGEANVPCTSQEPTSIGEGLQESRHPIRGLEAFENKMASFPADMGDLFVGNEEVITQVLNAA